MKLDLLLRSLARGCRTLVSRKLYIASMVVVPIGFTLFFINLMEIGLPIPVPVAVVDMDQTQLSRRVVRNLGSSELIDVSEKLTTYHQALQRVREGKIYGFFFIPENFQKDAINGKGTTLTLYSNLSYYVPGTLSFKGFKTIAVTTSGGVVVTTLSSAGVSDATAASLLQPVIITNHPTSNPWINYNYYLSPSFIPALLALMVMLVTSYSICDEIKHGTSVEWLENSGGSIGIALVGKLLPQTIVSVSVGLLMLAIMFGFNHFPLHNHVWHMIWAMVLLVVGCQSLAVIVVCAVPNLRLSLSVLALTGILSFSVAGFSFPVQSMYGAMGIFSYILPIRYFFLIYVDQALNGIPIYFSRWYYVALLVFPLLAIIGVRRLKKHCLNPVYVP
ncbi:MAG: ABC transporter permease [Bacteroidales bacterium]|nr:ABC transporter permease [Bacteroidales bacterium]